MNYEELVGECYEEWDKMHHNASLSGYLPDFVNEYEEWLFWRWMVGRREHACEHLSKMIEEKYGWKLTFWSYGGQGATIAPSEWMTAVGGDSFGLFASWKALNTVGSGLEGYNYNRQVLAILRWINRYWKTEVEYTSEWWSGMLAGNPHFQELIDEHEGMVLESVEMWVPDH